MLLLSFADFYHKFSFQKKSFRNLTLSECQTACGVQTVYKGYKQTTKVDASKERANAFKKASITENGYIQSDIS